jgi:hypothetical protein
MDWAGRRRSLLAAHAGLEERHRHINVTDVGAGPARQDKQASAPPSREAPQLHELREHHEELQEHHAALAAYQTELAELPPVERNALSLASALDSAEVMLVEAGRAADEAREAWRKATDVYKKVRDMLDREQ